VFAGVGNGTIKEFSPSGTLVQTLHTSSASYNTGMCFDSAGDLYGTEFGSNTISKFDNSGNLLNGSFGSGYNSDDESCSVDASDHIYVGEADGAGTVLKFDTSGNLLATYNPAHQDRGTDWVDIDKDQKTLFYTSEGDSVKRFDVSTNTQLADFADSLPASPCYALRILPDGGVMVACTSEVIRLNSSGNVVQTYTPTGGASLLFSLNIDPDGTTFWTGDLDTGTIYHFNIATGAQLGSFNTSPNTSLAGVAVYGEHTSGGPTGCTMKSTQNTTAFNASGQSIHIENSLNSDISQSQHLVLRSLSGPAQYFALTAAGDFAAKLADAMCHDNTTYPNGGNVFNTFTGDGSGVYGTSYSSNSSGYTIHVEIGDLGDTSSGDNTAADTVNFTIKNSGGTVVWSGKGNLTAGNEEEADS